MKPFRTKAIVLRRTNYGEADRILQVITPDHGKLGVMAKGVRREKSKLAGGIELFSVVDITLIKGKGDLTTITSARLDTFFTHILEDYDTLQYGYFVLKDIGKASEIMHEPVFFELCERALTALNDTSIPLAVTDCWYRLQMAILLGVGLNLATDADGEALDADSRYRFDVSESAFSKANSGPITADHIKLLRLLSAQSPGVVSHVKGVSELLPECLVVARAAHE
jgi:DNA repair protein RecO (recombination protein O)